MRFKVKDKEVFASTGGQSFDKKKPLIVFVHGSGLSHITWVLQTRYFAFHGYSVLAVDLPGHGYSEGPSLKLPRFSSISIILMGDHFSGKLL